jgi:hypothetical protein
MLSAFSQSRPRAAGLALVALTAILAAHMTAHVASAMPPPVAPASPSSPRMALRQQSAPPQFVPIDLTQVTVSFVRAAPVKKGARMSLVYVRVQCPSSHAGGVEAVELRVTPRKKDAAPVDVRRLPGPAFGRVGRAAFPGDPCIYPLLVPLEPDVLRSARFEVTEASAWLAPPSEARAQRDVPVTVGALQVLPKWRRPDGREVKCTAVPLTNLRDEVVEVVLEADFVDDPTATSLVSMQLQPRESAVLHVDRYGGRVARAVVVDWSILTTDGAAAARRLFTEAWDGWYRLPEAEFPLTASFRFDHATPAGLEVHHGEVVFQADGKVAVRIESRVWMAADHMLERAAFHLTRPRADVVLGAQPVLVALFPDPSITLPNHPTVPATKRATNVVLRDGQVHSLEDAADALADWESWSPTTGSVPWRLAVREGPLQTFTGIELQRERVTWARSGERWLPSKLERTQPKFFIVPQHESTISFERWSTPTETLLGDELPTGPLADELRAAWDGFHRHPLRNVEVAGEFELADGASNSDLLGRKSVSGTLVMRRLHGSPWRPQTIVCVERRTSEDELSALASAVASRVERLFQADPCCEPRFDVAFRGARLARDGEWITIDGSHYRGARLVAGELVALRDVEGVESSFDWATVEGARVPREVLRGDERIVLEWKLVADGWLWPTAVTRPGPTTTTSERFGSSKLRVSPLNP